jgi:hypothetical protein
MANEIDSARLIRAALAVAAPEAEPVRLDRFARAIASKSIWFKIQRPFLQKRGTEPALRSLANVRSAIDALMNAIEDMDYEEIVALGRCDVSKTWLQLPIFLTLDGWRTRIDDAEAALRSGPQVPARSRPGLPFGRHCYGRPALGRLVPFECLRFVLPRRLTPHVVANGVGFAYAVG